MTALIIVAILALVIIWGISVQRTLVGQDEKCKNAMSQIGVQQSSRWDALTALAELTKSYNEHEYNTIKDVIAQRALINSGSTAADADAQENMITQALGKIIAIAEQYPDLKANTNFLDLQAQLTNLEKEILQARKYYNGVVKTFNTHIETFPNSLVVGIFGGKFKKMSYVEVAEAERQNVKVQF